jgi:hypothetical protein
MANQRILYTEEMVGYNHPTKADTLNRHAMIEHLEDGTHGAITPSSVTCAGAISGTTGTFTGAIDISGAAAGQIAFPGTPNLSADVNTLDDYEEGTYTAIMTCGTSGTITLEAAQNLLSYTKIGRQVTVIGSLKVASVSSPVGTLLINLPFVIGNLDETAGTFMAICGYITVNAIATAGALVIVGIEGDSSFSIQEQTTTGLDSGLADNMKAATYIRLSFSYFTTV